MGDFEKSGLQGEKVLFLDVDGVLNRCGKSNQGLEKGKVELLGKIIGESDPLIVVSSSWRLSDRNLNRLKEMIGKVGGRYGGETPRLCQYWGVLYSTPVRSTEISQWMHANFYVGTYVILDDDPNLGELSHKLVRTESGVGLTPELAEEVIRRFSKEKKEGSTCSTGPDFVSGNSCDNLSGTYEKKKRPYHPFFEEGDDDLL